MIHRNAKCPASLVGNRLHGSSRLPCLAYPLVRFPHILGALLTDRGCAFFTPSGQNLHVITETGTLIEQILGTRIKCDLAPARASARIVLLSYRRNHWLGRFTSLAEQQYEHVRIRHE